MAKWPQLVSSVAFLAPILAWRADRRYQELASLPPASQPELPPLSIIIPARNEAQNLRRLLPSLMNLDFRGRYEVIVVNDNSDDETAKIGQRLGAKVISLSNLPSGWLGKPHACHQGAMVAKGDWFLFTDADTFHQPSGPARAIEFALENKLDGLSLFLKHESGYLMTDLTMTAAFAGLFAGLPTVHTILNGQYILLSREAYFQSGGFSAVSHQPLEDLALGQHLNRLGHKVPLMQGEDVAKVASYQRQAQLWQGMARIGAGSLHWSGLGGLVTALFIAAVMTPLLVIVMALARLIHPKWILMSWGSAVVGMVPWAGRFGLSWQFLLTPIGAFNIQLSSLWGLFRQLTGTGVRWKGRWVSSS